MHSYSSFMVLSILSASCKNSFKAYSEEREREKEWGGREGVREGGEYTTMSIAIVPFTTKIQKIYKNAASYLAVRIIYYIPLVLVLV